MPVSIAVFNAMLLWPGLLLLLLSCSSVAFARPQTPGNHRTPDSSRQVSRKAEDQLNALNEFQTVVPHLVDKEGSFLSYDVTHAEQRSRRRKRSLAEDVGLNDVMHMDAETHQIFYKISAYGIDFHFNLTLNTALLAPNYVSEFWDQEGVIAVYHDKLRQCHYVGHIANSHSSRVALSNCYGLHGIFATDKEEYFVEPLWNDTERAAGRGQMHVVYKRSAIKSLYSKSHCGVPDDYPYIPHWWPSSPPWKHNDVLKSLPPSHPHKHKWRDSPKRQRRSISTERHVETLVVVDKMMVGYHGKQEIEPYVLTIMNIVANLYHDASIGNAVNVIVTRLVLLTEDQPDLSINHHADRSLESFCRWQQMINPEEGDSSKHGVAHHDNAVLITRFDICTHMNQPCGTLGLAPVAGMCEPDRSCSINEDVGLATAFTIAHEIGHNFGMQHDGVGNKCGPSGIEPAKIMAPTLNNNTDAFSWSMCSRDYITSFLDSGRGKCLENAPLERDFPYGERLPGQIHDADAQCKFQYGSTSRQCRYGEGCRELYCIDRNNRCDTNSIPAAEGTPCSTNAIPKGWCYRGRCVKHGWSPEPVVGGWGEWSPWGQCSRTCGGGVESTERLCNSPSPKHGGKYCIGDRKRYRSCNIHDCPINSTDFRELQCAEFDEITFRGKFYKWQPFAGVGQMKPCALNCLATGFNFYTERAPKVKDGTRCYSDSMDICINGECKHVGCDRILGSPAVEDKCRVCGGDGSTCETISGEFKELLAEAGDSYHEVVTIPQGAVHIRVKETVMSRNYLALKSVETGKYYINGAWTIDWPRKFEVSGTVFRYERPTGEVETLTSLGPTSEDLHVMLLLQEKNQGIEYEYNMAIINETHNGTEYVWQYTPWSECSTSCAKGISESTPICVNKEDRSTARNSNCHQHLKPNKRIKYCNEEACPPRWRIGDWTDCSKTCGGGYQMRSVVCVQQVETTIQEVRPHDHCPGPRPRTRLPCNKDKCPPHWATDGWSDCKPRCGDGTRTRNVYCVSAEGLYMREGHCDQRKKPRKKEECSQGPCPRPKWVAGQWADCSVKCGQGQTMRKVDCRTYDNKPSNECDVHVKPHTVDVCEGPCTTDSTDNECKDVNKVAYCPLVLKFDFCNRAYFRQMCCKTCSEAGF